MSALSLPLDINTLVHKHEKPLFILHASLAGIFWVALVAGTLGIALLYVLALFVFYLFAQSAFIAWIKGNGVRIGVAQFADLHASYVKCCETLGIDDPPEAFLVNGGGILNALATRFLGRNFVVLYSNIVDALANHPEAINFYIGHELGHIRRKHLQWGPFIAPASLLPLLGAAYSRAREYTCDQFGRACCAEPKSALRGLAALAAGEKRWASLTVSTYMQQVKETGGFWMSFHELVSGYPWLVKRAARLINPGYKAPGRHPLAWLVALFVPGAAGGLGAFLVMMAMLGILAAVAVPAYQDYLARARHVGLGIGQASAMRTGAATPTGEAAGAAAGVAAPPVSAASEPIEAALRAAADTITRGAPQWPDPETRLDGATAGPGRRFTYRYTLPRFRGEHVPRGTVEAVLSPKITADACDSGQLRYFLDNDVTLAFEYRGSDGRDLGRVEVTRASCGA
jgi:Zn-dependent protease with chaperone function